MDDLAELTLEGVPLVAEHYDKVYEPVRDRTKQGIRKVKEMRDKRRGGSGPADGYHSDSDYEENGYGPPKRGYTDPYRRGPRDDDRRSSRRDEVVEERYAYRGPNKGRAVSMGRDGFDGRRMRDEGRKGRFFSLLLGGATKASFHFVGSRRDYPDSESSLSPPRRERRKSLGEKALVALGLGGVAGAAAGKDRHRPSRSRRRRSPSSSSSSADEYYRRRVTRSRPPPRAYDEDDRTPGRYKPASYIENGDRDGGSERGDGQQLARREIRSEVASSRGDGGKYENKNGSCSSDSSDVISSSEDERRIKKMKGREYLTAGLAAVATIHAAHSVYASMAERDKRHLALAQEKISEKEARKLRNKARLQDAAAIGIAALGIKGAYSEWQEVQEHRKELNEQNRVKQINHEKRMKRLNKQREKGGRARSEGPSSRRRDRS